MNSRLEGINYIRIIGMLTILLFHNHIHFGFVTGIVIIDEMISIGAVAIVAFFMISGFGLRHAYREMHWNKEKLNAYYKKRLRSFYPVYIFFVMVALICNYGLYGTWAETMKAMPMQLSALQILLNPLLATFAFNDNLWYLSALFVLYLLFPYLNEILNLIDAKRKRLLCVLLPVVSWYLYDLNIEMENPNAFLFYYCNPVFRIPEFFMGMLVADLIQERKSGVNWKFIVGGGTIAFVLGCHLLYPLYFMHYNLYNIIAMPYFAMMLFAVSNMREGLCYQMAKSRFIRYITDLGLAVYLCQSFSVMILERVEIHYDSKVTFVILTILFALFIHEAIEKPAKKIWKKRERTGRK